MSILEGEMMGDGDGGLAVAATALEALNRSEIDIQVATAKRYPRSIHQAKALAASMATSDLATAASCFYKIPRSGKMIEGPSVRLAEIFCSAWGNLRFGSRIIAEDDRFITAQGFCHDLQTNVATTVEVRRRITNSQNKKYNDDMIGVTGAAAGAIALRNAVYKVIPRSYINEVYQKAIEVAVGDAKTLVDRRSALLAYITTKMGIPMANVLAVVNRVNENDVDLNDMEMLYGLSTAVKDGDVKADVAFPAPVDPNIPPEPEAKGRAGALADKLKSAAAKEPLPHRQPETPAPPAPVGTPPGPASEVADPKLADGPPDETPSAGPSPYDEPPTVPAPPLPRLDPEAALIQAAVQSRPKDMAADAAEQKVRAALKLLPKPWAKMKPDERDDLVETAAAGGWPWTAPRT